MSAAEDYIAETAIAIDVALGTRRAPWSPKGHDPVPDGRTGPFTREPHLRVPTARPSDPAPLALDLRCSTCREA